MVNLLPLDEEERITSILPIDGYDENQFIFMATASGTVKKTAAIQFSRQRSVGLRAIELEEDDVACESRQKMGHGESSFTAESCIANFNTRNAEEACSVDRHQA